ncbi:MAG: 2-oxo acid dehydrogenase subunit E2 [Phycisphaeraceae bacterium]|nr:2-oxo acid dehydrogenase subunit E2 [Phycisphaeraceae bacterium]
MSIAVTMPRLSDTMERGTVVKWNVKVGDKVSAGDTLADIETDKATMELQAFDTGTVAALSVGEGKTVGVGETILVLAEEGESVEQAAKGAGTARAEGGSDTGAKASSGVAVEEKPEAPASDGRSAAGRAASAPEPAGNGHGRVFASPLARKLAAEKGVDLGSLDGSGPSGRIVKKDVEAAAAGSPRERPAPMPAMAPAAALEHRTVELSNMRATIARRLVESKTTIPHYQVSVDVDMEALLALRGQLNEQLEGQGVKLSVNDFLVRACAIAMHQHPFVNSRWGGSASSPSIEIMGDVNIGVAIALPPERGGGLVVATLRNADRMGLRQISADSKRLSKKAREKGLTIEEMSDGTFTISNLGMFGVSHFTAIINPPQTAILAVGAAVERPVVQNGQIVAGHVMTMTMSSDHRVIDGAMAAQYLATVRELLEKPATLLV